MRRQIILPMLLLALWLFGCMAKAETTKIWYIEYQTQSEIDTLEPTTGQKQVILTSDVGINDAGLSPDGQRIAYVTLPAGTTTLSEKGAYSVWVAQSDGSQPFRVPSDFTEANFFWLNNEQLAIATLRDDYAVRTDNPFRWEVFDIPSHTLSRLTTNGAVLPPYDFNYANPRVQVFQPDNQKAVIRFVHWQIQNNTLEPTINFQVDPSQTPAHVGDISATSDGEKIAFSGARGENNDDVFVATDRGRTVRQLTDFQRDYGGSVLGALAISPNGRWVIFPIVLKSPRTSDLKTGAQIMLADTDRTALKFLREAWGGNYGKFVWSADSRYVAVVSDTFNPKQTNPEMYLIDVETGEIKQLTSDGWVKYVFDWR